jgi:hypothetical protein
MSAHQWASSAASALLNAVGAAGGLVGVGGIGASQMSVLAGNLVPATNVQTASGLSINVLAGKTYAFEIHAYVMSSATAGSTLSLNFGSATVSSIVGMSNIFIGVAPTSIFYSPISAYTSIINWAGSNGLQLEQAMTGSFVVNAAGIFEPGYATAASSTTALLAGSWMRLTEIT